MNVRALAMMVGLLLAVEVCPAQTVGSSPPGGAPAASAPAVSSQEAEFATFGVRVSPPAAWKRLPEDQANIIGKWGAGANPASSTGEYPTIVIAEIIEARGSKAKQVAEETARKAGGEAKQEPLGLGDEQTWRVTLPRSAASPAAHALVAVHDQYLYRVSSYAMAEGADALGALEDLRRTWSFVEMTRPSQSMGLRDEALVYLDKLTMKPAAVLRPKPLAPDNKSHGKAQEYQIFNYRSGRADMIMTMEVDRRPAKLSLEQIGQALLKQMSLRNDPEHPITWKKIEGAKDGVICTPFPGARTGSRTVPLRFALVGLDDNNLLLLGYVFPTGDKVDVETYQDLSEAMARTVEPIKK
ncbi:MAG TPA: hypothetical protein VF669_02890 [Tepidisphaeraceae bacterium]|jgi:hypothetical protein